MRRSAAIVWRRSRQRSLHNARMRILVVEDNAGIAAGLQANLQQRRYAVDVCTTVAEAWHALEMERFDAVLLGRWPDENGPLFHVAFEGPNGETPYEVMERHGHLPLPPYIARNQNSDEDPDEAEDTERYQTVFASHPGAVAAPTAALHFDQGVLDALKERGVETASVTLHVGAGTFQPVKVENIAEHQMHSEWYNIPLGTLAALERCRQRRGRIIAVGTTSVRTLESWARTGQISGDTNIFITPGFEFRVVDCLITNFHLPKSTLMMLVSALAGYKHVMELYQHAVQNEYRFFSYGDSMLLERKR